GSTVGARRLFRQLHQRDQVRVDLHQLVLHLSIKLIPQPRRLSISPRKSVDLVLGRALVSIEPWLVRAHHVRVEFVPAARSKHLTSLPVFCFLFVWICLDFVWECESSAWSCWNNQIEKKTKKTFTTRLIVYSCFFFSSHKDGKKKKSKLSF